MYLSHDVGLHVLKNIVKRLMKALTGVKMTLPFLFVCIANSMRQQKEASRQVLRIATLR
jgi:hypothetical protein